MIELEPVPKKPGRVRFCGLVAFETRTTVSCGGASVTLVRGAAEATSVVVVEGTSSEVVVASSGAVTVAFDVA
ncbi:MAG: hypothetical protein EBZ77_05000, partial [Chitinophagia bacterium]|nr:hypothetical protein [Chitinophagia bacterium]